MVARPIAVNPSSKPCSVADQRKCSGQTSARGLNNRAGSPVSSSVPTVNAHLWALQSGHAYARLSIESIPPAVSGTTWSIGKTAACPPIGK
jgi:hypothetical protein